MSSIQSLVAIVGVLLCAIPTERAVAVANYSVKDLGSDFLPFAINNSGQIAGAGATSERATAFLLDGDVLSPIVSPIGEEVRIRTINNAGQVVGASRDTIGYDHAFVWDKASGWRNLNPPGIDYGWANGINDAGVIVGELYGHAVRWQTDGQIDYLGDFGGGYSDAFAINSAGDVVGLSSYDPVALQQHAYVWSQGTMHDLGVTDPITKGFQEYAIAFGINERGQVTGSATGYNQNNTPDVPTYGFLWDQSNGLEALVQDVSFYGLNNAGQAVGRSYLGEKVSWGAMLYDSGALYYLNDLIPSRTDIRLTEATGINDAGQIIAFGWASLTDRTQHGYLLTPIPEPAEPALIAIAMLVASLCLRRARTVVQ